MDRRRQSLGANIPDGYNQNLAELPADFVMTLGLFWLFAPRFDWCLGVAISFWGEDDASLKWPSEKNSELIARLRTVVGSLPESAAIKAEVLPLLDEATLLNDARNDFAHSFVLAHGPCGELFVQKVRVTNKKSTLELQEGAAWKMSDVADITHRLAIWCEKFEGVLAAEATKRWPA